VLLRLGHFDDGETTLRAQLSRAANAGVSSFHGFDGDHRAPFNGNTLSDIESSDLFRQRPTKLNVLLFAGGRRAARELTGANQKLRRKIGRGSHGDSTFGKSLDDNGQERVVVTVLVFQNEVWKKGDDRAEVWHQRQPAKSPKQQLVFEQFAGER